MKQAETIIALATEVNATIAVAESCTGGMVAAALTDIPGASAVFECGFVTYSNASKQNLLSVPEHLITRHGAVSEPVARAMAEGARAQAKTTLALSITGIAGPTGGSDEKPVGTVFIALASKDHSLCSHHQFEGTRSDIRLKSAEKALDLLSEQLALLSS